MTGNDLIRQLCQATGLPQEPLQREIKQLINKSGKQAEDITLDDLRPILVEYLQSVLPAAKKAL